MSFYYLNPDVPASNLARDWEVDDDSLKFQTTPKGSTSWSQLEFEYPLETEMIGAMWTTAVTVPLRDALSASGLTGFHFGTKPCELLIADWAENPDEIRASLQPLYCLVITGKPMHDDFGLGTGRSKLPYVTQAAADVITGVDASVGQVNGLVEVDSTGFPAVLPDVFRSLGTGKPQGGDMQA